MISAVDIPRRPVLNLPVLNLGDELVITDAVLPGAVETDLR
ncbi:hypothetical protein [Streptosporangium sp. NPDC051022]